MNHMCFRHGKTYDRFNLLTACRPGGGEGGSAESLALYRKVLAVDPADHVIHRKLTPSSRSGDDEALTSTMRFLRWQVEAREAIASLHCELQKPADAVQAPLDGYRHFRGRKTLIFPE